MLVFLLSSFAYAQPRNPLDNLQQQIDVLQQQIDEIVLIPGPPGPPGPPGDTGECDCPITQEQFDDLTARVEYLESIIHARFTDMSDGTIRDNVSGLLWLKNANCFGTENWETAMSSAEALASGQCGLTDGSAAGDWRLPTKEELSAFKSTVYTGPALVDTIGYGQWSEGDVFTGVQSANYWSSTITGTILIPPVLIYYMDMNNGDTSSCEQTTTGDCEDSYVWPVRSSN